MFLEVSMAYKFDLFEIKKDPMEAARWYKYGFNMEHEKCILCWRGVLETLDGAKLETMTSRNARLENTSSQTKMDMNDSALNSVDLLFDPGDEEGMLEYYQLAVDLGSLDAIFTIAMIYYQWIVVRRDDIYAIRLLARVVDAGSADAQFYLVSTYESNMIPLNNTQIVKLYADAAHEGLLAAFYYLGRYVGRPEIYVRRTHMRA